MVQTLSAPRFSMTTAECNSAVPASQGIRDAFSTGSQNQKSAPAQFVIGPIRAAGDAERQAHPGAEHPGPHPARPGRVDAAFNQGGDGEGECDRETDIAEVEHRRVEGETGVLQDRIEILALERRVRDAHERIRRHQNEKLEGCRNPGLDRERVGLEHHRQIGAKRRHQGAEKRQDRNPQHHRAFVIAPDAGQPVDQRHLRVRILVDVEHREVGRDVADGERGKGDRDESELRERRRRRDAHENRIVGAGADDRHDALDQRQPERQHQTHNGRVPGSFAASADRHGRALRVIVLPMSRLLQGVDDLFRHIGLVMLGENRIGVEHAAAIECAFGDDALALAKQIGQDAAIGTGISVLPSVTSKRTLRLLPRTSLPSLTRPPSRMRVPGSTCFSTTSLGELKNTIEFAECVEHERDRNRQHGKAAADQSKTSLLARHWYLTFPQVTSGMTLTIADCRAPGHADSSRTSDGRPNGQTTAAANGSMAWTR